MKFRTLPAILSFYVIVLWAENLTPLDFAEIEIFLYKSSMLNIMQKKLHQYLLQEKSFYSNQSEYFAGS